MENPKEKRDQPREEKTAPTNSFCMVVLRAGMKIYNRRKNPVKMNREKNPFKYTSKPAMGAKVGKCTIK